MQPPFRIGIAGANIERGWARDAHLPALKRLPGLIVQAVSARTLDIAEAAAREFGAQRAYADSLALAGDSDLDIIAVTVKVPEHRAIVLAALEAGKHVYCEWPLGRDLAEAEELASAARKAGVHTAIGLQALASEAVIRAGELVRAGAIGTPQRLRVVSGTAGWGTQVLAHHAYLQDRRNGATLATIAGGHTLAMVEAVIGPFIEVSARNSILNRQVRVADSDRTIERTCADHMLILGRHAGGCVSSVEIIGGEGRPLEFELVGSRGRLRIGGYFPGGYQCADLWLECDGEAIIPADPQADWRLAPAANVGANWRRFEADIRSGAFTVPNFDDAVHLTRLLDTIERASEERCVVPLATESEFGIRS